MDEVLKARLESLATELTLDFATLEKIHAELGATTVDDLTGLTETDLIGIGLKALQARALLKKIAPAPEAPTHATSTVSTVSFDAVLPPVPNDESWLSMLKAGGVLKIDISTVISAIRAALAHRAGLFSVPDGLVKLMERFADENEEQVGREFYGLRKQLTRRNYGEIFEAIDGLEGSFVTEARKKQLFDRIDNILWPALIEFFGALKGWQEAWMQGASNPMVLMAAFMGQGSGMAMPAGMMQPPDTGTVRDSAEALANAINKVFAGTGVQISSALAFDATKIRETISNDRLPAMIGAANRDQMLKQLGVAVPATYPRLETNLVRFVLAALQLKDLPAGNEELQYLSAMYMLGSQITWDQLAETSSKPTGIGGSRR